MTTQNKIDHKETILAATCQRAADDNDKTQLRGKPRIIRTKAPADVMTSQRRQLMLFLKEEYSKHKQSFRT